MEGLEEGGPQLRDSFADDDGDESSVEDDSAGDLAPSVAAAPKGPWLPRGACQDPTGGVGEVVGQGVEQRGCLVARVGIPEDRSALGRPTSPQVALFAVGAREGGAEHGLEGSDVALGRGVLAVALQQSFARDLLLGSVGDEEEVAQEQLRLLAESCG